MLNRKFQLLKIAGVVACSITTLMAGDFARPAEGPVPFRRDRIPLEADAMADLSAQLVTLATSLKAAEPLSRRGAAQALALSLALDPANTSARKLLDALEKDGYETAADGGDLSRNLAGIWQCIAWLETPEAGESAHALAACLKDVLAVSDPDEARAAALREAGEKGRWTDWVPELAAYQNPAETTPVQTETLATHGGAPLLAKARILVPMWTKIGDSTDITWSIRPKPLIMEAEKSAGKELAPFSLVIGAGKFTNLENFLLALLRKEHGELPAGVRVVIGGPDLEQSLLSKKSFEISAAAAVLASAAITGQAPEATILGTVDQEGAFLVSFGLWDQLRTLGPGNGGRLILPSGAVDYLPSMLALEKPAFFVEHEVLIASNFRELLALSAKTPAAPLATTMASFRDIRDKATPLALGSYLTNSFVRRRLAEIAQNAPFHASSKLLGIQGAGNRPLTIPRQVLITELRNAIQPIEWLTKSSPTNYEPIELAKISTTYESARAAVDGLVRYADKADREMLERTQQMVTAIRTLDRARRARPNAYDLKPPVTLAHADLVKLYASLKSELAQAVGEPEADVTPPP